MVSSTKASTLIRPTTDTPPPTHDKISVVTSAKADKVCHVCSKQIVDCVQLSTQSVAAAQLTDSSAANSSTPNSTDNHFVCNICVDGCQDPVVTHCGHLFCWPCLFCWLSQQPGLSQLRCPVCKANVQDKIIPLYNHGHGRKAGHTLDSELVGMRLFPNKHIPCRPLPSRLSELPPISGTSATESTDYYAGRDADLNGSSDHQRNYVHTQGHIAEEMQYHGNAHSPRRAELHTSPGRRFSSEKEFVLHWAFICMASIATVCFVIAC